MKKDLLNIVGRLLPEYVYWGFDFVDSCNAQFALLDHDYAGTLPPKRLAEFIAGRVAARASLAALGWGHFVVRKGPKGEPLWPSDIVGSISHSRIFGLSAAASVKHSLALGVDIDDGRPLADAVLPLVCRTDELASAQRDSLYGAEKTAKLLFSIKESFFKAYFPATQFALDFHDVRVNLDWSSNRCRATLVSTLAPALYGIGTLDGRFAMAYGHVISAVAMPRADSLPSLPQGNA